MVSGTDIVGVRHHALPGLLPLLLSISAFLFSLLICKIVAHWRCWAALLKTQEASCERPISVKVTVVSTRRPAPLLQLKLPSQLPTNTDHSMAAASSRMSPGCQLTDSCKIYTAMYACEVYNMQFACTFFTGARYCSPDDRGAENRMTCKRRDC